MMQRLKNNSRAKVPSNFKIEIVPSRKNSLEKSSPHRPSNRRIHVHSSLLHAQRNIKLITKTEMRKQLLDTQYPDPLPLPKLKRDGRNHSTLDKDISHLTDNNSMFSETFSNSKDFNTLKNLLYSVKESKRKDRDRSMNLLGLQIKRIEPQPHENKIYDGDGLTNMIGAKHSCSIMEINQADYESKLILKEESNNQQEEQPTSNQLCTRSAIVVKKKALSLGNAPPKYDYYHNKVPKFNFSLGSEGYKIYERRMKVYRQFIYTIQMGHNVYIDNEVKAPKTGLDSISGGLYLKNQNKYKIWIGGGNNWMLIKSLIKRRYWWLVVQDRNLEEVNFVWTQLKVAQIFQKQKPSQIQQEAIQLRKCFDEEESDDDKKKRPQSIAKRGDRKQADTLNFQFLHRIIKPEDKALVKKYLQKHQAKEKKLQKPMQYRHKNMKKPTIELQNHHSFLVHNHLENNFFLGNKKAMFHNLKQYYQLMHDNVFNYLPLTFHIRNGTNDIQYKRFQMYYKKRAAYIAKQQKQQEKRQKNDNEQDDQDDEPKKKEKKLRNIWIVKPGELSNRGNGITVIDEIYEINNMLTKKQKHDNGTNKTFIVQLYIDRPLLYNNRKFDIRHYMLITNMFGVMRGYWYNEGYIRTASYEFDVFTFDRQVHLTNDAVQKHTANYGKYQPGNKLSYSEFQRYLDSKFPKKGYNFQAQIIPKMKKVATDAVRSVYLKLSPQHKENNFQIFGLDFMIDNDFKPWLIEINTNPCLELSSPLLERIIPVMVENSFRLSLDVMFPPPAHYPNTSKHLVPDLSLQNHKYQLIFDSLTQGAQVQRLYKDVRLDKLMDQIGAISDEEDEYADDGEQLRFQDL